MTPRPPVTDWSTDFDHTDPPKGITLADVSGGAAGFTLTVKAAADAPAAGYADNLIMEAFTETVQRRGAAEPQKRRVAIGVLPAIPFEIVKP